MDAELVEYELEAPPRSPLPSQPMDSRDGFLHALESSVLT